jgi:hypothetical protein
VVFASHISDNDRYRRLNDAVCAITGEVREPAAQTAGAAVARSTLVWEVSELIWEPPD